MTGGETVRVSASLPTGLATSIAYKAAIGFLEKQLRCLSSSCKRNKDLYMI